jgi:hypothetical protein
MTSAPRTAACAFLFLVLPLPAAAQMTTHQHHETDDGRWRLVQDGAVFVNVNHQGGDRGGTEVVSQNWWMATASRRAGTGVLKLNLMVSLEPATVGADGYRELFQTGETFDGFPLVDRQHPHDFLMQAAVVWRTPLTNGYTLTLAGAPVGEPALGPIAFMHRASAFENPTAPLAHHNLDSTHIAMGVLTAGVSRGRWTIESSLFHGGEPDEQRWDLMDPGALDSWSVRWWYKLTDAWTLQASHGFLKKPEAFQADDVWRTTASASWTRRRASGFSAATIAYGIDANGNGSNGALLAEGTIVSGSNAAYARAEAVQAPTDILRFGGPLFEGGRKNAHVPDGIGGTDVVGAFTVGAVRSVWRPADWDVGVGADATFYRVPSILTPLYGERPVSFHVFVRLRPRPPAAGRMLDMNMTADH